eukprot:1123838-Pleurochrysis_carterae.AAC.1
MPRLARRFERRAGVKVRWVDGARWAFGSSALSDMHLSENRKLALEEARPCGRVHWCLVWAERGCSQ